MAFCFGSTFVKPIETPINTIFNMNNIIILTFFAVSSLCAQDFRGLWTSDYAHEGDIDQFILNHKSGNEYIGESYDRDSPYDYCKFVFKAKYDSENNKFLGYDAELIEKSESHTGVAYRLAYRKGEKREYLEGNGRFINSDGTLGSGFRASYSRPLEQELVEQISEEDKAIVKQYKSQRKNPTKANLNLANKKVTIKVHDYGKEDHDSISIIYNDELLAYKIPIDSNEKTYQLHLQADVNNSLTFIAHNLGDVAPNTTYVEILADDKVFKYTLFTDLRKNAVINLRLRE